MKTKLLTLAILLGMNTAAQAFLNEPNQCPATSSIISAGLDPQNVIHNQQGWDVYSVLNDDNIDWTFAIVDIAADSAEDAYHKASKSLNSLSFHFGPFEIPLSNDEWACTYNTAEGYEAIAITGTYNRYRLKHLSL